MGDSRNKKTERFPKRQQAVTLVDKPFKALKGFKVGPVCLKCEDVIDLRRQSTGNGYVHSSCEPKRGEMPRLHVIRSGEDDLLLVRDYLTKEKEAVA